MRRPYWIPKHANPYDFPPLEQALTYPDGLLAVGGDLSPSRIMVAYRRGIFPWYDEQQPILWWSPSRRMVLFPEQLKVSRSLRKTIRHHVFVVTIDQAFQQVISNCAITPRHGQNGTWITREILDSYQQLHGYDFAHSIETWFDNQLVGGLYGVALGKVFYGESMFSHVTDASKVALVYLVRQLQKWGFELIDCQVYTDHLASLGAIEIPRTQFRQLLDHLCDVRVNKREWHFDLTEAELL